MAMARPSLQDEREKKKGPWTPEEDKLLVEYIEQHGLGCWKTLPALAGLNRCGKSCRLRWINYLRPDIKRGEFSPEEEDTIVNLHSKLGNRWSAIAAQLKGRTDNEIKNHWNTHLRKKLLRKGIDPVTHQPRPDLTLSSYLPSLVSLMAVLQQGSQQGSTSTTDALALHTDLANLAKLQLVQMLMQVITSFQASPAHSSVIPTLIGAGNCEPSRIPANQIDYSDIHLPCPISSNEYIDQIYGHYIGSGHESICLSPFPGVEKVEVSNQVQEQESTYELESTTALPTFDSWAFDQSFDEDLMGNNHLSSSSMQDQEDLVSSTWGAFQFKA